MLHEPLEPEVARGNILMQEIAMWNAFLEWRVESESIPFTRKLDKGKKIPSLQWNSRGLILIGKLYHKDILGMMCQIVF